MCTINSVNNVRRQALKSFVSQFLSLKVPLPVLHVYFQKCPCIVFLPGQYTSSRQSALHTAQYLCAVGQQLRGISISIQGELSPHPLPPTPPLSFQQLHVNIAPKGWNHNFISLPLEGEAWQHRLGQEIRLGSWIVWV